MIVACFHGAESTGKSAMAARLQERFGWPWLPEYGREYCEALFARTGRTELSMEDLLAIARGQGERQAAAIAAARGAGAAVLVLDTDPLMTAAWAEMLFGAVPGELLGYPRADRYLLFAADVPWVADGSRFFGSVEARARFAAVAEGVLRRAGVGFARVAGDWDERERAVVAALA